MTLTLSLPIFWHTRFLSTTFILTVRGIMPYEASTFSKIAIIQFLLSITFYKYPKSDLSSLRHLEKNLAYIIRVREVAQVANWRRWQSALTLPIGDVGNKRVNDSKFLLNHFTLITHVKSKKYPTIIWKLTMAFLIFKRRPSSIVSGI